MATIEAMSMGCVPIAWDIETGTKEIAKQGETGLFAPLGDMKAFAIQVCRACNAHDLFISNVMKRARITFSRSRMWETYNSLFEGLRQVPVIERPLIGHSPPPYRPPRRIFQLLPRGLQRSLR